MLQYIYLLLFFVIWWSYAGYVLVLYYLTKKNTSPNPITPVIKFKYPFNVSIIIPTYNEENYIERKIKNLFELTYLPNLIETIIVDSGSTDSTLSIVKKYPNITLLTSSERNGKISDINTGIAHAKGDIIIISDADSILSPNSINIITYRLSDSRVGVVGICTIPSLDCPQEETEYWVTNNKIKFLESRIGAAHSMIAGCYGFRKTLFDHFPPYTIADDVYITLKMQSMFKKTIYTDEATVTELRVPISISMMIKHKLRKGVGFIHEFLSFMHLLFRPNVFGWLVYPTKLMQLLLTPIVLILFIPTSIYFILHGSYLLVLVPTTLLAATIVINSSILSGVYHPPIPYQHKRFALIIVFVISNITLLLTLLLYPFAQKTSKYRRIK